MALRKYGLIGLPLEHSFSRLYFTEKFSAENIDAEYNLYPLKHPDEFIQLIRSEGNLTGLNVTIPYKEAIIPFLDELSPEALAIGAVNTISFRKNRESLWLCGHNTDAPAFESEIQHFTEKMKGNALVLGNGGAAKAAVYVLNKLGWNVKQLVRSMEKIRNTSSESDLKMESILSYDQADQKLLKATALIVNATPVGMYPEVNGLPPIPVEYLSKKHLIFDMIYNPETTRLIQSGNDCGAKTSNGMGMLKKQAELSWKIWQIENNIQVIE